MEEAVLAAVDSWRGRLPREAPELGGHLERMDLAARKAAEAVERVEKQIPLTERYSKIHVKSCKIHNI